MCWMDGDAKAVHSSGTGNVPLGAHIRENLTHIKVGLAQGFQGWPVRKPSCMNCGLDLVGQAQPTMPQASNRHTALDEASWPWLPRMKLLQSTPRNYTLGNSQDLDTWPLRAGVDPDVAVGWPLLEIPTAPEKHGRAVKLDPE